MHRRAQKLRRLYRQRRHRPAVGTAAAPGWRCCARFCARHSVPRRPRARARHAGRSSSVGGGAGGRRAGRWAMQLLEALRGHSGAATARQRCMVASLAAGLLFARGKRTNTEEQTHLSKSRRREVSGHYGADSCLRRPPAASRASGGRSAAALRRGGNATFQGGVSCRKLWRLGPYQAICPDFASNCYSILGSTRRAIKPAP